MMIFPRLVSRFALPVVALAMLSGASRAQAPDSTGQAGLARDSKASSFPFDWREGMIFLPVRINGSNPLAFVLDSGSSRTLIDRALATRLGLQASGTDSLQGAGSGRIAIENVHGVSIGLPGVESSGYDLSTADLQPLQATLGVKVDGILGYEFFSRFVVTVDYNARSLTLTPPGAFRETAAAQVLPIELKDKWAYVKADLVLPGPVTVQDSFMIDSGSSDAVDHPIVMKLQSRVPSQSGVGLGTPVEGATARATSFRLGRYTLNAPVVSCCGATDATSRMIGNEVLRRFTVTFDYPGSRIFITPNADFQEKFAPGDH